MHRFYAISSLLLTIFKNVSSRFVRPCLLIISSGQEIIASFAVKPTSSIINSRETIDKKGKNTKISVRGRHDPCVGIRAVPIGEDGFIKRIQ